jgi:hypothetical protein
MMAAMSRLFKLARCARRSPGGHTRPLAPPRIPTILALEVEADRKTSLAQEAPGVDPENVS